MSKTLVEKSDNTNLENSRLHQHSITVDADVKERINKRIQNLQTELEGIIDHKFNQILQK